MTDFLQLAHDRYSCRDLSGRPVEAEKIEALVDAAVAAPTAVNRQPWHLWVVESPDAVERLSALTRFSFGARVILMLGARADEAWTRKYDGRNFADVDASIVGTHIMLAAHDLGLGTTWVGHFDAPAVHEAFPETEGYDLVALFPVGYPAEGAEPSANHAAHRPTDELVSRI
ncbi:nitroreductase family protein [Olsenella sp. DSM 107455]|uniref:Nitroreductase family protein n=1 Tax=Thermophilibacter gallinarum TaxID=2779357 RepID=A0ABR9QTI4_9ACTN|nr:nitroreductase family protein [Thermophilibacter gallinarum]MBE5024386.1 nitroreductase family protein [Thermophilibacter gallinarum]